jgi:hypothetical protein
VRRNDRLSPLVAADLAVPDALLVLDRQVPTRSDQRHLAGDRRWADPWVVLGLAGLRFLVALPRTLPFVGHTGPALQHVQRSGDVLVLTPPQHQRKLAGLTRRGIVEPGGVGLPDDLYAWAAEAVAVDVVLLVAAPAVGTLAMRQTPRCAG